MTKKSLLLFIIITFTGNLFAQKKYVIVPLKVYKHNKIDIYGLSSLTNQLFAKSGYLVFTANQASWPDELKENPCLAIYTETEDVSPLIGLTKIQLTLKNCYQQIIAESIGKDNDSDDLKAIRIALEEAFNKLKDSGKLASSYDKLPKAKTTKEKDKQSSSSLKKESTTEDLNSTSKTETAKEFLSKEHMLRKHWEKYKTIEIEGIYTYDDKSYTIEYSGEDFELRNNNVQLAKLEKTSKYGIYKVFWNDGKFDIAYIQSEKELIIEQTKGNKVRLLSLQKVYRNE